MKNTKFIDEKGTPRIKFSTTSEEGQELFRTLLVETSAIGRIKKLRRHPELVEIADVLEANLGNWHATPLNEINLSEAQGRAALLDVHPSIVHHHTNLINARKPRGPRLPAINDWLSRQDTKLTADQLYWLLPESHNAGDDGLYRDEENGNRLIYLGEKKVGFKTFQRRLGEVREAKKNPT